ncbi:glycosyltransferase [Nakamurella deserti]|uniref:glycosyltransferase n=1 Tax=Nakamurella deserti TaxID=2164074 RepID=UPI00130093E1|nr:glycosyltransferase [Nakamurella deserti]
MTPPMELTVVVPWLQGGGAQEALSRLIDATPSVSKRLVIVFRGSRNHGAVLDKFDEVVELGADRRNPVSVLRAAVKLRPHLRHSHRVYSLMRASNVVIGLVPGLSDVQRLAMSFHMLPVDDRSGPVWRLEEMALRRATRQASLVTSPSHRAVDQLRTFGLSHPDRTRYVPNRLKRVGVALPVTPGPGGRLLCAGRLEDQKGMDRLPDWLAAVTTPVELRIAGQGSQETALRASMTALPDRHRVDFLGHVGDLTDEIDACDAVLMPSRQELNPMLVWEAWQRGKPVVATRLDVFVDLAAQGPVLFADDGDELAAAVRTLGDHGERERLHTEAVRAVQAVEHGEDVLTTFLRTGSPR